MTDGNCSPFDGDYPDPRTEGLLNEERAEVAKQVDHLVRLAREPQVQADYVAKVADRRARTGAVPLEQVRRDGAPVYVAAGSLLIGRPPTDEERRLFVELGLVVAEFDARTQTTRLESDPTALANRQISTPELAAQLRERGLDVSVNHIVPLGVVMKAEGGPEPTALSRPFPAVAIPAAGTAPLVAVIDNGISLEQRTDGYLQNLVLPDNVDPLDVFPSPGGDGKLDAAAGHGSFVAGVVQQVAPSAQLRIYKATDSDGICTDAQVGAAIRRAGADGAAIINLSLGTTTDDGAPPPAMLAAITQVVGANPDVLIVVAAGNDGASGEPVWPAALAPEVANVVSVAGLAPDGGDNAWSTRGDWVTCSTIGEGVASTYVIGTEDGDLIGDPNPDTYGPDSWAIWTGTSFAAPQIAGGVARLCHEQNLSPVAALGELLKNAPADLAGFGQRVTILPGT
jgi:thermitase